MILRISYKDHVTKEEVHTKIQQAIRPHEDLSSILFNIFMERIITDALEDDKGTVSTGGRTITNLRFADDINGLAGEEEELAKLVEHLNKASTANAMKISMALSALDAEESPISALLMTSTA